MATSHSVWGDCPAHKRNQLAIPGGLVYPGVGIFQSYRLLVCGSGWGGLWTATLLPRLASLTCALWLSDRMGLQTFFRSVDRRIFYKNVPEAAPR